MGRIPFRHVMSMPLVAWPEAILGAMLSAAFAILEHPLRKFATAFLHTDEEL